MKNKRLYHSFFATLCLFSILPCHLYAQREPKHDSSYYTTYLNRLTTRIYFSKKYTSLTFPALDRENDLQYRPNTKLTLGVGATYNNLSLNLSYGFGVINPDDEKGETKSIDLEIHIYPNKWAIDFLGIHHKGMHINPKGYAAVNTDNYYYRPDAIMTLVGLGVYRVINRNRFSYNAAMIQSEWQKKSAGSFLYGGEFYYGSLSADSSLVPKIKENLFTQSGINKMQFFTIGAGIGYAYTLVVHEHFYATGSLITNLDINFSTEHNSNMQNKKTAIAPSFNYKTAIGYNSDVWDISANWAANALWVKGPSSVDAYTVPTGNYRIILAKRINIKRR